VVDQDEETRQPFNSPFTSEPEDIHEEATFKPFISPFAAAGARQISPPADEGECEEEPAATTPGMPAFVLGEDDVTQKGNPVAAAKAPAKKSFGLIWIGLGFLALSLLAAAGYFAFGR
jgi:hypothetical protein